MARPRAEKKSQEGGSRLLGCVRFQDWERRKAPRADWTRGKLGLLSAWRSSRKSGRKKGEGKMESSGILPVRPATMWPL